MNILDIFFPRFCVGCGRVGSFICSTCAITVGHILPNEGICPECKRRAIDGFTHPGCRKKLSMDGLVSFFHYRGVIKKSIKEVKYRFISSLIDRLISVASDENIKGVERFITKYTVIVPIPLSTQRKRFRGFNQAECIAKSLSLRFCVPYKVNIISRIKHTSSQTSFHNRIDRITNMKGVFKLNQHIAYSSVLLVDDVFTTGATMKEATKVLKASGVKRVFGVTIAR